MGDIYVYLIDLPNHVSEMVIPCYDGYTIYIDANLTSEQQQESYCHAMNHIMGNDFNGEDIQKIEVNAHKGGIE